MKTNNNASRASFFSIPFLISLIALILAAASLILRFTASERTVYVNTGVILEKYEGMIDVKKKFDAESKEWQSNIDTLTGEFQNALKKFEKDKTGMSQKEKEMAQELLKTKQQQLGQYQQAIQNKARDEQSKLSEGTLKQINTYIQDYGKQHHYNIIFGTNGGNIVYADKSTDITDIIVDGLNKDYKSRK